MIEMDGMAEFVDKDVADKVVGEKQKFTVDADCF
jgi:hypothetical protein